jgi:hypothetical protein
VMMENCQSYPMSHSHHDVRTVDASFQVTGAAMVLMMGGTAVPFISSEPAATSTNTGTGSSSLPLTNPHLLFHSSLIIYPQLHVKPSNCRQVAAMEKWHRQDRARLLGLP